MSTPPKVTGIILAAGLGKRFGGNKLLHPLNRHSPDEQKIGVQSALNLKPYVDHVICIVRPEDKILQDEFKIHGFNVIVNPEYKNGLSSSLMKGIYNSADSDYWVIALGDMPFIKNSTYGDLRNEINTQLSLSPCHRHIIRPRKVDTPSIINTPGHPVCFPQKFKHELLTLDGDKGAKAVLQAHNNAITWLDCQDKGVIWDVDTKQDLAEKIESKAELLS